MPADFEEPTMARRTALSFRTRTVVAALIAALPWLLSLILLPLAAERTDVTLFGLPLRTALALPVALPLLVLTMFWFAARQNRDDERFRDDD
jgi:hypothetical protein